MRGVSAGPNVDRMEPTENSPLEQALAAEVRSIAARKSLSHKEIQERSGVGQRSWRRYFVECNRAIPIDVVVRVAGALDVAPSELVKSAEASMSDADPIPRGAFTRGDLGLAADTTQE